MRRWIWIFCLLVWALPAQAISLISDEETETWLFDILTPIFKEANLPLSRDYVHIVKDDSLNAFVGDKNHMFVHTGTLIKAKNANEIEGVLAHETGHILGGHLLRMKIQMQDLNRASLASLLAAAGAAAASGRGDAAIAVVLGTQSSALNAMTSYQVTEERAADETAVMLLHKNKKSVQGIRNFMQKIQHENRLQGINENPYFRTHPITTERIAFFEDNLKRETSVLPEIKSDERLRRIQAKLFAYIEPLDKVLRQYPLTDTSLTGNIAHTVYFMRQRKLEQALKYAEKLIRQEPNNPYFWELKAQALFESGKIKQAVAAYAQTLKLAPQSDLFKLSYTEAVLAAEPSTEDLKRLIILLEQANRKHSYPIAFHYLGKIYATLGQIAISDYYAAEYNAALGENHIARRQLDKALKAPLREDIRLRAEDLRVKLHQENRKKSLF